MPKPVFILILLLGGTWAPPMVHALPAPSSLSAREHRASVPRATPTPVPQRRVIPEGQRPSTTIVIDAGHGGFDRGGIAGQRVDEKTMNLDVALRLRSVLQSYGQCGGMTRE